MPPDPTTALLDSPPSAGGSLLDELLTAGQMARVLQMPQSTVEEYARRRLLPSVKLGRHRRFIRSDVERAIVELACGDRRRVPVGSSARR